MTTIGAVSALQDAEIRKCLEGRTPDKWVNNLKPKNRKIATLFHAVVNTPGWIQNRELFKAANEAREHLKSQKDELPKDAIKTYRKARKTFKEALPRKPKNPEKAKTDEKAKAAFKDKAKATSPKGKDLKGKKVSKKDKKDKKSGKAGKAAKDSFAKAIHIKGGGIKNIGNSCWMNALLQHFRTIKDFDSIFTGDIHSLKPDEKKEDFEKLQTCLREVVDALRDPTPTFEEAKLQNLEELLLTCKMIDKKGIQHDASEVLSKLLSRFGQSPKGIEIYKVNHMDTGALIPEEKAEPKQDFVPLQTTKDSESITELLQKYFGERSVDEKFRGNYKKYSFYITSELPKLLQLRLNKAAGAPHIEHWVDLKPLHRDKDTLAGVTTYGLGSALCRSGAQVNDAGGHFWYVAHDKKGWKKFDDKTVSELSEAQAKEHINKFAYTLFYFKQPRAEAKA